jgi:hypothetical protein
MIFGFNTDIQHQGTVYHVQSEAREHEHLLQTQVFVRGRCIGKHSVPYAVMDETASVDAGSDQSDSDRSQGDEKLGDPKLGDHKNDQHKEKMLRDLHREVLDAIRDGRLESFLGKQEVAAAAPAVANAIENLDLEWTNADSVHASGTLTMQLKVTEKGSPIQGARLTFRFARPHNAPYYAQVMTDSRGTAEMKIQVDEGSLPDSSVLVQASFEGRTATRKFQLRHVS